MWQEVICKLSTVRGCAVVLYLKLLVGNGGTLCLSRIVEF